MNNIAKSGPLPGIGSAFIPSGVVLFYATSFLRQQSMFTGIQYVNDENVVVPYPTPFVLWAIPVLLLAAGVICLAVHAQRSDSGTDPERDDPAPEHG